MNTMIENIWQDFAKNNSFNTGIVMKRYSPDVIPDCFVSMKMPEKIKSIAFRLSSDKIDISALNDLIDISAEIVPDATSQSKFLLLINLADNSLTSIFAILCEDLFSHVSLIDNEKQLILSLQNRFLKWKELFMLARSPGLSLEKQVGLFGELYFLKKLIIETNEIEKSLNLWVSPDNGIRDFEKNKVAIEVKTTYTHNHQKIKISSERQLDTSLLDFLFLFHLSLEKRNGTEYTLNTIVDELFTIISNNRLLFNSLKQKLMKMGYFEHHKPIYQNISYLVRGEDIYRVHDNFPRIEEKHLLKGVGDVKYTIILSPETENFKSDFLSVIKTINLL